MPDSSHLSRREFSASVLAGLSAVGAGFGFSSRIATRRFLYVAVPGIRDYLEFGGHGVLVFDVDDGHRFVRRITAGGKDPSGKPRNVKGIAACASTKRLYVSTTHTLECFDLATDTLLWERAYDGGCDRMSIASDGSHLYLPSFEGPHWNVVAGGDGRTLATIRPDSGAHNTVYGPLGRGVYLAGLKSNLLTVADPKTHRVAHKVGPFGGSVRPFTVDGTESFAYCCVNGLLGFEIADLAARKVVRRVEVEGYKQGVVKRHGCPSHGIGLAPDGKVLWVCDSFNKRLHVFDLAGDQPRLVDSLPTCDEAGWVTFSIDGLHAYPSTGEVFDTKSRQVVTTLKDEFGKSVQSEKLLEIDFEGDVPTMAGDQFARGVPPKS